ncbi:MAG: histidinol-phosphate transaminase [Phycisphaerae bacterium]|nr:histidinol-phosphate transaminase [Phycisphaerae bacterium]
MSYFRDNIEAMAAYVPGEQPASRERVIKLNTNENPYPPSPAVARRLREFSFDALRVYPDPRAGVFVQAVSEVLGIPRDRIQAGNGSDNLLVMIARAAAGPGRRVAYPGPTFPFYETQALVEAAEIVEVPFEADYAFPLQDLLAARAAVTFVANPNSPTGTTASLEQLETLARGLQGVGLLVIDEAYVDFAEATAIELPARYENVVVLRTLSKGYSLAGLRLGFAVAQPGVLRELWKTKEIYNVSSLTEQLGAAAVRDQDSMRANAAKIRQSRAKLAADLQALGWSVWPSQANFILARPPRGNAREVYEALKAGGILVRYFQHTDLADKLRITIGTDEQNAELLKRI